MRATANVHRLSSGFYLRSDLRPNSTAAAAAAALNMVTEPNRDRARIRVRACAQLRSRFVVTGCACECVCFALRWCDGVRVCVCVCVGWGGKEKKPVKTSAADEHRHRSPPRPDTNTTCPYWPPQPVLAESTRPRLNADRFLSDRDNTAAAGVLSSRPAAERKDWGGSATVAYSRMDDYIIMIYIPINISTFNGLNRILTARKRFLPSNSYTI